LIPKADNPDYITAIKRICEIHQIKIIFPLVTLELFLFARHKLEFEQSGINVIVSENESLQIANNKGKLYRHLFEKQIKVPDFFIVDTVEEFKEAAMKLGYPNRNFCFKPCVSNGSRGFRIISRNINEHELLFQYKPNTTFITNEKAIEILSSSSFPQLLVTEYLPGDEYTIDTIVNNGSVVLILPRKRIQMREGISIKGEFVKNEEIISYCKEIINSLNLNGPIGIQVKKAADGSYKILEINPRIQGSSTAALGMGINLPLIAVLLEVDLGKDLIPEEIKWGMKFTRYYEEVFY
jgi:carbamoyl-phosphate synthase large subunit